MLDELAAEIDRFDGTVARIARELVARCRELTTQINALERELECLWTANSALHMAAVTQTRGIGTGKAYVDKLLYEDKTGTEALRLRRRQPFRPGVLCTAHRRTRPAATRCCRPDQPIEPSAGGGLT
ncbi:hypothetical protein Daura_51430 [Dactylosporangium aurantiacum]|uniref:Uncharacterized protein n=1 Tax=Dactylosporangium aurantiacum TaxID=35754 RepID=A0A9Q9IFV5_9ACTN|nr:hypothetical protein [Dactylosporangium aurantiacum]MDG6101257.1 hypothetical protein [Dactylosporangium aurantiacum]UWZ54726.1 hypothetical protein Daura_51430 [Dactylosporangium aurantiacum]